MIKMKTSSGANDDYVERQSERQHQTGNFVDQQAGETTKSGANVANETGMSNFFRAGGSKLDVIEFHHLAPSKLMQIEAGVELIEKGKSTKGDELNLQGKYRLEEYRNLHDPQRYQQGTDTMMKKRNRDDGETDNQRTNEDPYRTFRRSLVN